MINRHVFFFFVTSILLTACNDNKNPNNDITIAPETRACGQNNSALPQSGNKFLIDNYMPLKCKGSNDLNGIWLITSKLTERTVVAGTIYETRGQSRGIAYVNDISPEKITIRNCGELDSQYNTWDRNGNNWSLDTEGFFNLFANRSVISHSNDHLTLTEESGFRHPISYTERIRRSEMQWIKVSTLSGQKPFGKYTGDLSIDSQVILDNATLPVNCFYEITGESMVDASNAFTADPIIIIPESSDWAAYTGLAMEFDPDTNDARLELASITDISANGAASVKLLLERGYNNVDGHISYTSSIDNISADFVDSSEEIENSFSVLLELD